MPMARAMRSVGPPGAKGTTMRRGLEGKPCAWLGVGNATERLANKQDATLAKAAFLLEIGIGSVWDACDALWLGPATEGESAGAAGCASGGARGAMVFVIAPLSDRHAAQAKARTESRSPTRLTAVSVLGKNKA